MRRIVELWVDRKQKKHCTMGMERELWVDRKREENCTMGMERLQRHTYQYVTSWPADSTVDPCFIFIFSGSIFTQDSAMDGESWHALQCTACQKAV